MKSVAIKVNHLSKRYLIYSRRPKYRTLRDTFMNMLRSPFQRLKGEMPSDREEIWALDNISFEVKRGSVIGIIGHNGAGKSTLLKVLSRITEPTLGSVDLFGRVGSLLEVGTGFHNELSGRENIYLNGAILGMPRQVIDQRFDEIVAFAEVERFIDTPVKYYSSGMYLRLAFAVAAHLEPEILLVDEVLAVGDAAFQKKCLGKMGQVAEEGRTVLFVSHDMTNIAVLCRETIWLDKGQIAERGPSRQVIEHYINSRDQDVVQRVWPINEAPGGEIARIIGLRLQSDAGNIDQIYALQSPIRLIIEFVVLKPSSRLNVVLRVKNSVGLVVFTTANYEDQQLGCGPLSPGRYRTMCTIPAHIFNEGSYPLDVMLIREMRTVEAEVSQGLDLVVYDSGVTRGDYVGEWAGVVRPHCNWTGEILNEG